MAKGRPKGSGLIYDPKDFIEEIDAWLSSGRFLAEYCRQTGKPSVTVVHGWMVSDKEIAERIAQARARGAETLFEQNLELADAEPPRDANGRIDPGFVAWHKNRIWARMEMLKRINPKKYGDKVEQTLVGDPDRPVAVDAKLSPSDAYLRMIGK